MVELDDERHVAELVQIYPVLYRVFERLGIDYCCGGRTPLREACRVRGLDPDTVRQLLEASVLEPQVVGSADSTGADGSVAHAGAAPADLSTEDLVEHIVGTHHAFLRREIPRLTELVQRVASHHGPEQPHFYEVARLFDQLQRELMEHQDKEERQLFPALVTYARSGRHEDAITLAQLLNDLEAEHDQVGELLRRLGELTGGFTPAEGACNSTRAMLHGLKELTEDTHRHVHKENHILFPRVVERAA